MRLAVWLWLAAIAASAQTVTTVPQLEVPVGGPTGSSIQGAPVLGLPGQGPALISPTLSLTPSVGLAPVLTITPITALSPIRAAPSAEVKTAAPVSAVEALKTPATGGPVNALPTVAGPTEANEKTSVPGAAAFDGTSKKAPIDLDAIEAEEGEAVVDTILREHDPATHAYVGVGRSPAILIALMQNRNPALANTLPLSDFYHHPAAHPKYYPPLSPELETRIYDHLDRYLPASARSGEKSLVLIDFVKGGRSMVALDEYLKRYAARRAPAMRWTFFGLGLGEEHVGFTESGRSYRVLTPAELGKTPAILHTRLSFSWNKDLAEYGEFPAPFDGTLELRAEYDAWRKRLAKQKKP